MPDRDAFNRVAGQIESSPYFTNPAVKCETAASLVAALLEAVPRPDLGACDGSWPRRPWSRSRW